MESALELNMPKKTISEHIIMPVRPLPALQWTAMAG